MDICLRDPAHHQVRIPTVDDHPVLSEGIAAILASEADMVLVPEAGNGHEPSGIVEEAVETG